MLAPLLAGVALFLLTLGAHVAAWRAASPYASALVLVAMMFAGPLALLAALFVTGHGLGPWVPRDDVPAVALLHAALAAAYIASYPAARAVSPTLDILHYLGRGPVEGLRSDEITQRYTQEKIVHARIDDLRVYRLLVERGGRIGLTPLAAFIAATFQTFRRVLGLPDGEG